jgi:competence protein ComEA
MITIIGVVLIVMYNRSKSPIEITISDGPLVLVNVRGEVTNPGFYCLDIDHSFSDAIAAAGGFTAYAAADYIEQYFELRNRVYIYVPSKSDAPQRINVNTADLWLLDALPGIGETLAQQIIHYRSTHGPFTAIQELTNVCGIGDSTFNEVKDKITV